jgi:riboflavin-specific deaminase-like protein
MKLLPEPDLAARAWPALLEAARHVRGPHAGEARRLGADGPVLAWDPRAGWSASGEPDACLRAFAELYLPLCAPRGGRVRVVAQLGQSLDGCIATASGESRFVTGEASIDHLHRLRALVDAVIVGAGTVAADDPRLTTRRVPGPSPLRVVIDPRRRLSARHGVFSDGAAPTLLVCAAEHAADPAGDAEVLGLPARDGQIDRGALLAALAARGCAVVLVEGGGVTVSGFMEAGLLDRLHLTVAPLIIGDGRKGLQTPTGLPLARCPRPRHELYRMGADLLYDCEFAAS